MIGLTSVTFRKKSPAEIVRIAVENRLQMIEWGGDCHVTTPIQADEVHRMCAGAGLATPSYGSYFTIGRDSSEQFRHICETAVHLTAGIIRVWLGNTGSRETDEREYERLLHETEQAAEIASRFGQSIAFEFHRQTYNDCGSASRRILEDCRKKNVRTYWQPFYEGMDSENLAAILPFIQNVHVFYWNAAGKRYRLAKGEHFWREWTAALQAAGFGGDYILEFCRRVSERIFRRDAAFLHRLIR